MTKEEARAILEEVKSLDDSMYQYNSAYLEALEVAVKALERTTWISVSERLPKAYEPVLRSVKSIGWNLTGRVYVDIGTICPMDTDVIAWMPLPEPYDGGDTD